MGQQRRLLVVLRVASGRRPNSRDGQALALPPAQSGRRPSVTFSPSRRPLGRMKPTAGRRHCHGRQPHIDTMTTLALTYIVHLSCAHTHAPSFNIYHHLTLPLLSYGCTAYVQYSITRLYDSTAFSPSPHHKPNTHHHLCARSPMHQGRRNTAHAMHSIQSHQCAHSTAGTSHPSVIPPSRHLGQPALLSCPPLRPSPPRLPLAKSQAMLRLAVARSTGLIGNAVGRGTRGQPPSRQRNASRRRGEQEATREEEGEDDTGRRRAGPRAIHTTHDR